MHAVKHPPTGMAERDMKLQRLFDSARCRLKALLNSLQHITLVCISQSFSYLQGHVRAGGQSPDKQQSKEGLSKCLLICFVHSALEMT